MSKLELSKVVITITSDLLEWVLKRFLSMGVKV